jgi:crossover junction endodeoxyribonuclease RuvC
MDYINLIGIDPGNHIGLSVLSVDPKDLSIKSIYTKTITLERLIDGNEMVDKLILLRNIVNDIYTSFRPLSLAIETSFLNMRYPKAVIQLSQYVGTIELTFKEIDPTLKIFKYAPMFVKSIVSGKGNSDKDAMAKALKANKEFKKLINIDNLTEHEVDATCIAYTSLQEFRLNWYYLLTF